MDNVTIKKDKKAVARLLYKQAFNPDSYELNDKYTPWEGGDPLSIHTLPDLIKYLESEKGAELEARVLTVGKDKVVRHTVMDKKNFLESVKKENTSINFREADSFQYDDAQYVGGNLVGEDNIPLLGGPFNKQLYYVDYLKQAMSAFFAYHNDGFARRIIQTYKNFTLGRGYRVDCENQAALALWKAFERANKFDELMEYAAIEAPINGEIMIYWVPEGQLDFYYDTPASLMRKAIIPRVKLLDSTTIWEIITMPENFEPLFYQQIYPTQYQLYGTNETPTAKFIYQQLPAKDVMHFKLNSVSNEKRGRSDLFPILGYLKRLRDLINYKVIAEQKNSAWAMDTIVKGSQVDLQNYMDAMNSLGSIPEAGSEFVHTEAITRQYLSNNAAMGGKTESFEQVLSMISAGCGLPISYFGTHTGNSTTRASAITATEPVAKLFEMRQLFYERIILQVSRRLFDQYGFKDAELEISFPDIVSADRSAKLQDLAVAESQQWFSKARCAAIAAKELGVTDFDYSEERNEIEDEKAKGFQSPALAPNPQQEDTLKPSAMTSDEKSGIKDNEYNAS